MDITRTISAELDVRPAQVARTVELLDDGNTVPFIARYRKEMTGELDETQIRAVQDRLSYLRTLEERKETVLQTIADQGELTPELEQAIRQATVQQEVEDLYLPYRPKRRTRATMARERGLAPLADAILAQEPVEGTLADRAAPYLSDEVPTVDDAYAGARDIVAETVAEDAAVRQAVRSKTLRAGVLIATVDDKQADPQQKYKDYYDFQERLATLPAHRLLALNRGEEEGVLKVKLDAPQETLVALIKQYYPVKARTLFGSQMREAQQDAYKRLIGPAIERELRSMRTDQADLEAIQIFQENLRSLLLQPPLRGQVVMGIDPGYRTGSKVAVVDATSRYLDSTTIYPHAPQQKWDAAKASLIGLIRQYDVQIVAVGNGTASRETEALVAEIIGELAPDRAVKYAMVSEAGASVYSASPLAREELPHLDVAMRGAVSIARRLQDPLAELVKIDPKSIGIGLYQHDVNQKQLGEALDAVVESAVNYVGVDVNTASPALLSYVAGISSRVASNIVAHRDAHGPFRSRRQIFKVKGIGSKTFEQAAGFMRIPEGDNPLDNTAIHPESYPVVERLSAWIEGRGEQADAQALSKLRHKAALERAAKALQVGVPTLSDIVDALLRPGRDPRDELPPPILRQDVLKIEDLSEGMVLQGTVRNVVPFGAFVDIGVKQDGLVHISQMADRYVEDPMEIVSTGDVIRVRVLNVDIDRGRIGLTMKGI